MESNSTLTDSDTILVTCSEPRLLKIMMLLRQGFLSTLFEFFVFLWFFCSLFFKIQLLAVNIRSNLRILGGRVEPGPSVISISYEHLFDLIEDETPIVMKSVCEALRLCLPTMLYSTMYNLGE